MSFRSLDWFMRACLVIVLLGQCKCFVTIKNVSFSRRFMAQKISSFPAGNSQVLYMSSASADKSKCKVLYQKVVRPQRPPLLTKKGEVSPEFLGLVVEYLQSYFQVPIDLPMQYEKIVNEGEDTKHSVITISSPLSNDPSSTNLDVEVIGIYPDNDSNENSFTFPTMAMIALKKMNSASSSSSQSSMVDGLFQASEKKIIQALEQGLNDFIDGRIKMKSYNNLSTETNDPAWELQQYMEQMAKEKSTFVKRPTTKCTCGNDHVIDTTASSIDEKDNNYEKHTKECRENQKKQEDDDQSDYAVKMAVKIAEAKAKIKAEKQKEQIEQQESNDSSNDFAVQAALKKQLELKKKDSNNEKERKSIKATASTNKDSVTTPSLEKKSGPSKAAFRVSISKPSDFKKKQQVILQRRNGEGTSPTMDAKKPIVAEVITKTNNDQRNGSKNQGTADIGDKFKSDTKERKINVNMNGPDVIDKTKKDGMFDNLMFAETKNNNNQSAKKVTKTNEEIEQDILKAAIEFMPDQGDLSAEELLDDVLKFGKEKEKEEEVGTGFVSGAFQKAKELMTDEKERIDAKKNRQRVDAIFKEPSKVDFMGKNDQDLWNKKDEGTLSAEEELKRIFAAGENIVESRSITTVSPEVSAVNAPTLADQIVNEEYIENLIEGDKTVPKNARSIDDELAELELRINRTPGENTDRNGPNKMFDVFSGPEVYNPNVDPLTAVNWPGAPLGTRNDIRLPPELKDAVEQAQFASKMLRKIRQVENEDGPTGKFFLGEKEIDAKKVSYLRKCVEEAVVVGLIPDPLDYLEEEAKLRMVLDEMSWQPIERFEDVASNYRDLLLSDNFADLVRERLEKMREVDREAMKDGNVNSDEQAKNEKEREVLGKLITYAQLLLKEARALGAELEASHLEVIRSICQVAMDPNHQTEEETSMALTDAVRDMRPLFDDSFVAYLKYAIAEEQGKLARSGLLDDPEHNRWLFVLKIVQEGVYAELSKGINRYIDHIWYVLRMESKSERRMLLEKLIDVMPSMDVRPFVKVVDNIVASLGSGAKGEFDTSVIGSMTNKLLQMRRDVQELLPPDRIKLMSRDADEWISRQREKLREQRKITKQRLKAAEETADYDEDVNIRKETERMT